MEGSDRRLGWIVIAVGALILGYMLGSARSSQPAVVYLGSGNAAVAPQAPQAPDAPGQNFGRGRGDRFGQQGQFQNGPQFGPQDGPQFGPRFGPGMHGHRPFFLMPFMFLGGLLKLGLVALLVFWVLRRWKGGPPWARRWREDRPTESEKKPAETSGESDDSTYTGGTTKL